MHNQTRYTRCASFGSNNLCVNIKHFIIQHMLVQALEPSRKGLDDEDLVLYFNRRIPMIAKFPFLSYCAMFGVKSSTELEKPVLITLSIVRPPLKRRASRAIGVLL